MKTLGRIILLIVSIVMTVTAVNSLIYHFNALNATGWDDVNSYPDKLSHLFAIILQFLSIFCALTAFIAFIRGKASFRLIIYAVVLMIPVVLFFINANKAGQLSDWRFIIEAVIGYSMPILYALGAILVMLSK